MKIMIINGPSLNMLGIREPGIYGKGSLEDLKEYIKKSIAVAQETPSDPLFGTETELVFRQSNHEGDLIDWIQEAYFKKYDGVVINPGGYTHTSIALADAAAAVAPLPVAEVHISDIDTREDYRKASYLAPHCIAQIKGQGFDGYVAAVRIIQKHLSDAE